MKFDEMMKQAQQWQSKLNAIQQKMENIETEGSSGGGMVHMVLNGKGNIKQLKIDPSIIDSNDSEILSDLIIAAFNDAKHKLETLMTEQMSSVTNNALSAGFKLPF